MAFKHLGLPCTLSRHELQKSSHVQTQHSDKRLPNWCAFFPSCMLCLQASVMGELWDGTRTSRQGTKREDRGQNGDAGTGQSAQSRQACEQMWHACDKKLTRR